MGKSTEKKTEAPRTVYVVDEVHEAAKAGQHGASKGLRKFGRTVDAAIPGYLQPLRKTIVDAAIELADRLVADRHELHRSIVRSADRALSK